MELKRPEEFLTQEKLNEILSCLDKDTYAHIKIGVQIVGRPHSGRISGLPQAVEFILDPHRKENL